MGTFIDTDTNTHTSVVDDGKGYVKVSVPTEATADAGPEYTVSVDTEKLQEAIDTQYTAAQTTTPGRDYGSGSTEFTVREKKTNTVIGSISLNAGENVKITGDENGATISAKNTTNKTLTITGDATKTVTLTDSDNKPLTATFTDNDTTYTAGANVQIEGNVISATDTKLSSVTLTDKGDGTSELAVSDTAGTTKTVTLQNVTDTNTVTDVEEGDNIEVTASTDAAGNKKFVVATSKDVKFDNITVNNSVTIGEGDNITNITGDNITLGDTIIEGDSISTTTVNATTVNGDTVNSTTVNATTVNGDTINTETINLGDNITIKEGDNNSITYTTKEGDTTNTYHIATVEDGLSFKGDAGDAIHKELKETLDIVGGAEDKASENNIYTYSEDGKLHINLAKDIKGVENITVNNSVTIGEGDNITNITGDKITLGDTIIEGDKVTVGDTVINNNGLTINNGPSFTKNEINVAGNKITNVYEAEDDTDAVNLAQVKKIAAAASDNRNVGLFRDKDGKQTIVSPLLELEGVEDASAAREVVEIVDNYADKKAALEAEKEQMEAAGQDTEKVDAKITALNEAYTAAYADYEAAKKLVASFAQASGTNSVAIGTSSKATAENAVAIGKQSTVTGSNSIAIGTGHTVSGSNSGAIGDPSIVSGDNSYAIGNNNNISVNDGFILGNDASVTKEGGVALGTGSQATTDKGEAGYDPSTNAASTNTDATWKSTAAAVSVGGTAADATGAVQTVTRQITNVAAGSAETDAVNVAQLKVAQANAKTEVVAGNENITVTPSPDKTDGHTIYTIEGLKTAVTSSDGSVSVSGGKADKDGVITYDLKVEKTVDTNTTYTLDVTQTENKGEGTTATVTLTPSDGKAQTFDIVDTNTHTSVAGDEYINVTKTLEASAEAGPEYTVSLDVAKLKTVIDTDTRNTVVAGDRIKIEETPNKDGSSTYKVSGADVQGSEHVTVTYDNDTNAFTVVAKDLADTSLTNITEDGETVIQNIAQDAVKVAGDKYTTVSKDTDDDGNITYKVSGAEVKAGDNIAVTYSEENNQFTVATASDVKFENVEVTNEFKAGDTVINEGGITTNNVTTNEFKAGDTVINEGGITTNNINSNNIETKNINVTENITYKGDHIVTDVTYEGDSNTLTVTKGDEVTNYVLKGTTYEGDNKTIQISENNVISVIEGNVAEGDSGVVTGDTVYKEVRVEKDGNYIRKDNTAAENITALDEQVQNNATNIQNLGDAVNNTNNQVNQLDNRMKKGLAGAAAMAMLHPMDFNPDDKLQFSAGVGNYRGETAAALGAFYRPDESVMFSIGGTFGNADNMVGAGITFGLDGTRNRVTRSRTAMAKEIVELRSLVTQMAARMDRMEAANGIETAMFPDVPENHWAYEYVEDLQKRGALEGYPDGLFKGDRAMTRYEFAAMLDRLVRKGITLDSKIAKEFEPELGRIYVERISGQDNDRKKIERVRVNNEDAKTRDFYGSKIVTEPAEKVVGE